MKSIQFLLLILLSLFTNCHSDVEISKAYYYKMVNASSHLVTVELDDSHGDIPNPLILKNNEVFEWLRLDLDKMPFAGYIIKVTFDSDRQIVYTVADVDRNPYWPESYVTTEIREDVYTAVYTFTDEDYENAAEIPQE